MSDLIQLLFQYAVLIGLAGVMYFVGYRYGYRNGFRDGTNRSNSFIRLKRVESLRRYGRN